MIPFRLGVTLFSFLVAGTVAAMTLSGSMALLSDEEVGTLVVGTGVFPTPTPSSPPECAGMTFDQTITGTSGSDIISVPGSTRDLIFGLGGEDIIDGGHGPDCIVGGDGNDDLKGGDDVIQGGPGNDKLEGGNGDDRLYGGEGDDTISGSRGNDHIDGGPGADTCDDGAGSNTLVNCEAVALGVPPTPSSPGAWPTPSANPSPTQELTPTPTPEPVRR